jgi:hypothetical protein
MKYLFCLLLMICLSSNAYSQNYIVPVVPSVPVQLVPVYTPVVYAPVVYVQQPVYVTYPYYTYPTTNIIIQQKRCCLFPQWNSTIIQYPSPPIIRY